MVYTQSWLLACPLLAVVVAHNSLPPSPESTQVPDTTIGLGNFVDDFF